MSGEPTLDSQTNRAFYDRIARAYDLISDASEEAARRAGEAALGLEAGEAVLEIGFGTGNGLLDLAAMVGDAGKVCGIDVSSGMAQVARAKIDEAAPGSGIELKLGDARGLPYEDGAFDAVFASFTLELFSAEDIPRVLAEVRRVLRPGGRFGSVSMARVAEGEHESLMEKAYVWMHRHFPHIVDCRPIDLASVVQAAGLEVTHRQELSMWSMPVAVVVGRKAS